MLVKITFQIPNIVYTCVCHTTLYTIRTHMILFGILCEKCRQRQHCLQINIHKIKWTWLFLWDSVYFTVVFFGFRLFYLSCYIFCKSLKILGNSNQECLMRLQIFAINTSCILWSSSRVSDQEDHSEGI